MTPDRLMYSPSKQVFVFTSNGKPVQVGSVPHYRNKHDAVRAALKQGLLVDLAGKVTQVDDEDRAAYQAAHAKLEEVRPLEGTATLRTRVGTRVRFRPNPASLALYSNPPEVGEEGEVTTVAHVGGRRSSMKGPGGGLLYVKWDKLGTMGVSPRDVEVVTGVRAGKGRPGQRIERDDVVIETTLHTMEFDGAEQDILHETKNLYLYRTRKGLEIRLNGPTAAVLVGRPTDVESAKRTMERLERYPDKLREMYQQLDGPVRSMNYGQLPKFEEFKSSTTEHFPYPMELVWEDQQAVEATGLVGEEGIDPFTPSTYLHKYGVRVKDAEAMYRLLQALIEFDEDDASDLASAILGTLGYEWV